jgi:hypothetical protein
MAVPNIFGTATAAIPLSQLDTNFATAITLGNTAVYLGNTTTSLGNVTLTNVTISSGNVTVTGANISGTANVSTLVVTGNQTSLGNVVITGNVSANIATFSAGSNTAPSITTTGDTNTGIFFPAADTIAFAEGGAEVARFDSSGNFGIGTSSPLSASGLTVSKNSLSVTTSDGNFSAGGKRTFMDMDSANNVGRIGALSGGVASGTALALYYGAVTTGTTNEGMRIDSAGLLKFNSGYGSVATAYGCRVWVQFNGTGTISITGSGNVSSLSDFGTGDYGVTFTTNMPDTTYCVVGSSIKAAGGPSAVNSGVVSMSENINTYSCGISVISASSGAIDRAAVFVAVFR